MEYVNAYPVTGVARYEVPVNDSDPYGPKRTIVKTKEWDSFEMMVNEALEGPVAAYEYNGGKESEYAPDYIRYEVAGQADRFMEIWETAFD